MARNAINSDKITPKGFPFSAAVWAGDILYLSGQVGLDLAVGKVVDGGAARETEQILKNCRAVLAEAGKTFDDVIKANVYLVDMADFAAMNEVYAHHFKAPYPARTSVEVASLPLGARVEIEMIAR
ncbi:MAG: Rid family detoxifying hydrolase [Parvularculaceae bacterium]